MAYERPQFVYVLSAGGFVKIGRAGDVFLRIKQLQCGCPSKISPIVAVGKLPEGVARDVERAVHGRLSRARSHGEWFSCTAEQAVSLLAVYGMALVGANFLTFDPDGHELVSLCLQRESRCRNYSNPDAQATAEREVKSILSQFPSLEEEMAEAVNRLPVLA